MISDMYVHLTTTWIIWIAIKTVQGFYLKLDSEVLRCSGLLENALMWPIDYFDVGF